VLKPDLFAICNRRLRKTSSRGTTTREVVELEERKTLHHVIFPWTRLWAAAVPSSSVENRRSAALSAASDVVSTRVGTRIEFAAAHPEQPSPPASPRQQQSAEQSSHPGSHRCALDAGSGTCRSAPPCRGGRSGAEPLVTVAAVGGARSWESPSNAVHCRHTKLVA
jgi:hypothetical protein